MGCKRHWMGGYWINTYQNEIRSIMLMFIAGNKFSRNPLSGLGEET
jgi:hypothetical protein